ncbi:hypothetical protein ILUMI_25678 [Ignelater luminosus]|uniref:Uncharacterized protein n=1 Tax=Ignelater luminosus TaxID=2038154 RepID=A0A8K0C7Y7_IGNLU|nr:hypothetical protein ILUMI_25678 [Ignelater luminosus]
MFAVKDLSSDQRYLYDNTSAVISGDLESEGNDEVLFLQLPCHTQAVKRGVKTVTEASLQLCDKKSREAFIKTKIHSRKRMLKFESNIRF